MRERAPHPPRPWAGRVQRVPPGNLPPFPLPPRPIQPWALCPRPFPQWKAQRLRAWAKQEGGCRGGEKKAPVRPVNRVPIPCTTLTTIPYRPPRVRGGKEWRGKLEGKGGDTLPYAYRP